MPQFTPPVQGMRLSAKDFLFSKVSIATAVGAVLKTGLSYRLVAVPRAEEIEAADKVYLGGHTYTIDSTEAAALTAAGYTVT